MVRKDLTFIGLWISPFFIFLYPLGFVQFFYLIPVLPIFCIGAARLIIALPSIVIAATMRYRKYSMKNGLQKILLPIMISAIGVVGFSSTTTLITTNLNSAFFEAYATIDQHLPDDELNIEKVTMIGRHWARAFYWVPYYIFDKQLDFKIYYDFAFFNNGEDAAKSQKIILVPDKTIIQYISSPPPLDGIIS